MRKRTAILGIDIQNDFTLPSGSLFVKGADVDAVRIAAFVDKHGSSIDYIALTLDSHQPIHIANQYYWKDFEGYPPALFSIITAQDVREGKWMPQYNKDKALPYLEALEQKGAVCTIWPAHCIMGSPGWAINSMVMKSISAWNINTTNKYDLYFKGTHQATEHYSIFRALVEFEDSEETKLNQKLLSTLESFDRILLMGQAADFCVVNSLIDLLDVAPHLAKRVIVLTDCMSWIDPGNERAEYMFDNAREKGVRFTTLREYTTEDDIE